MVRRKSLVLLAMFVVWSPVVAGWAADGPLRPLFVTVDMNVGETREVALADGSAATVKLVDLTETRDSIRQAVRRAEVVVEVNGQKASLVSAMYRLPREVGGLQIDCPVTCGYIQDSSKKNVWALEADVRLRLWPADSPWIQPETFMYPVRGRWFASDTQMANDPCYVNGGEEPDRKQIYYHYGLDVGGVEGETVVQAATDGVVISVAGQVDEAVGEETQVAPRGDVVYLEDARGWHYRYSHLHTIDPAVKLGAKVKMGQRIGLLGKEGASGGWSHLHFGVSAIQPSGQYGCVEPYAFYWQAALASQGTRLQAVARPHHYAQVGQPVELDGSRSFAAGGPDKIKRYEWTFTDGTTAEGVRQTRVYDKPGTYSEVLRIVDAQGQQDYDFAVVQVVDLARPGEDPPSIHAAYEPSLNIRPGDAITFKVRSFRLPADVGSEVWDFGDGSRPVTVRSDGCQKALAKDGYAIATHAYRKPGHYLVRVQRTNDRGETAVAHLHVRVEEEDFARWNGEMQRFAQQDAEAMPPSEANLFVGSSSIRGWNLQTSFPDLQVINRGFGGSQISDSIHFADRIIFPYRPRVVLLYAGDNDIAKGKTPERVVSDFLQFVATVHEKLPETRIVFLAIKPSGRRWHLTPLIVEANNRIRAITEADDGLEYCDIASLMLGEDGLPRAELFKADQLHPSEAGYALWAELVRPYLVTPDD